MSDKPLLERLQVKGHRTLAVVDVPTALDAAIGGTRAEVATADVLLAFYPAKANLLNALPLLAKHTRADAIIWIAYPKLTSKLAGDLNRDVIHELVEQFGLSTVTQIALDADWSAMRLKRHPA